MCAVAQAFAAVPAGDAIESVSTEAAFAVADVTEGVLVEDTGGASTEVAVEVVVAVAVGADVAATESPLPPAPLNATSRASDVVDGIFTEGSTLGRERSDAVLSISAFILLGCGARPTMLRCCCRASLVVSPPTRSSMFSATSGSIDPNCAATGDNLSVIVAAATAAAVADCESPASVAAVADGRGSDRAGDGLSRSVTNCDKLTESDTEGGLVVADGGSGATLSVGTVAALSDTTVGGAEVVAGVGVGFS